MNEWGLGEEEAGFLDGPNSPGVPRIKVDFFLAKRRPVWTTCHEERAKDAQLF